MRKEKTAVPEGVAYKEVRRWPCVFWVTPISGVIILTAGIAQIFLRQEDQEEATATAIITSCTALLLFVLAVAFRFYQVKIQDNYLTFGYASLLTYKRVHLNSITSAEALENTSWKRFGGCGVRWVSPNKCGCLPTFGGPGVRITVDGRSCANDYTFLCAKPQEVVDLIQQKGTLKA